MPRRVRGLCGISCWWDWWYWYCIVSQSVVLLSVRYGTNIWVSLLYCCFRNFQHHHLWSFEFHWSYARDPRIREFHTSGIRYMVPGGNTPPLVHRISNTGVRARSVHPLYPQAVYGIWYGSDPDRADGPGRGRNFLKDRRDRPLFFGGPVGPGPTRVDRPTHIVSWTLFHCVGIFGLFGLFGFTGYGGTHSRTQARRSKYLENKLVKKTLGFVLQPLLKTAWRASGSSHPCAV